VKSRKGLKVRWLPVIAVSLLALFTLSAGVMAQSGNIGNQAIQIDGNASSVPGADHYANLGTPLNGGAQLDWQHRDQLPRRQRRGMQ
jgi:hypothetical protein